MITKLFEIIRERFSGKKNRKTADISRTHSIPTDEKKSPFRSEVSSSRSPRKKTGTSASKSKASSNRDPAGRRDTSRNSSPPWRPEMFQIPEKEGETRFHELGLPNPILRAIQDAGFRYCTPIQAEILPETLKGRDAFGRAQTGTGKTAAFLITVLNRMITSPIQGKRPPGAPRVLIIAPTRELVLQIADEANILSAHCRFSIVSVFGGMDYEKQRRQLHGRPVDIIVATPGRLLDFRRRKDLNLNKVEILVLDEADRMLDMGFIPDVRQIVYSTPHKDKRQTLFFSATLTPDVTRLSASWTRNPVSVEIEPEQVAVETVEQVVYIVTTDEKFALTYNILTRKNLQRVLIFCNRRDETRRLAQLLDRYRIDCALLSGEVPQKKRIRTLERFKKGKVRVLVATDVAGRGIHIEDMDYVINFTLPHDPEDYVHRIGRTGRAGAAGTSISFACEEDSFYIPAIEEFIGRPLHCIPPEETYLELPPPPPRRNSKPNAHQKQTSVGQRGNRRRRRTGGGGKRRHNYKGKRPSHSRAAKPAK